MTTSMSDDRPSLADVLRAAVRATGRPVGAVARSAAVPQPVLHRFMKGDRGLTLDTADRLARHLRLELRPTAADEG